MHRIKRSYKKLTLKRNLKTLPDYGLEKWFLKIVLRSCRLPIDFLTSRINFDRIESL